MGVDDPWHCPPDSFLYRVTGGTVCAGVLVRGGKVIEAAPVLKWTVGQWWTDVMKNLAQRGWRAQLVKQGGSDVPTERIVIR